MAAGGCPHTEARVAAGGCPHTEARVAAGGCPKVGVWGGRFPWWWRWQERRCVPTDWSRAACVLLIPRDRLFAAVGWSTPASAIGWSTQSASVGCTHTQRASHHPHVDVVITAHYTVVTTGVGGKSRRTGEERDACNRNDDANPHSTNLKQGITGTHTHIHTHTHTTAVARDPRQAAPAACLGRPARHGRYHAQAAPRRRGAIACQTTRSRLLPPAQARPGWHTRLGCSRLHNSAMG